MKILINNEEVVITSGVEILRGNFQDEENIIKVIKSLDENDFYYIATSDRDSYVIIDVNDIPGDISDFKYIYKDNKFYLNPFNNIENDQIQNDQKN
jgi:hypothetical protein